MKPVVEAKTATQYFRVKDGEGVRQVLERAEDKGLLKSSTAVRLMNRLSEQPGTIRAGTYELSPSMTGQELLGTLLRSGRVRQDVLIREGLSTIETARILESKRVADKKAFLDLCRDPKQLSHLPRFVIVRKGLEGYLFPDTHNLPPLLGARDAAEQLLSTFEHKVYKPLGSPTPQKMRAWVIIGSMVELEARKAAERPRIAGVIYNRLTKGIPLQIDATVAYGLNNKRRLLNDDYRIDHPYNTYKIKTLPPGPICSPGASSIKAAARPEKHGFLYYVAMPDGSHRFAKTYAEHLTNVAISRKAFGVARKS